VVVGVEEGGVLTELSSSEKIYQRKILITTDSDIIGESKARGLRPMRKI
jgi:hypothetical protein